MYSVFQFVCLFCSLFEVVNCFKKKNLEIYEYTYIHAPCLMNILVDTDVDGICTTHDSKAECDCVSYRKLDSVDLEHLKFIDFFFGNVRQQTSF